MWQAQWNGTKKSDMIKNTTFLTPPSQCLTGTCLRYFLLRSFPLKLSFSVRKASTDKILLIRIKHKMHHRWPLKKLFRYERCNQCFCYDEGRVTNIMFIHSWTEGDNSEHIWTGYQQRVHKDLESPALITTEWPLLPSPVLQVTEMTQSLVWRGKQGRPS